ncbi:MAG: O-antigen acetylase [Frankiales bacterium]|nr:O-antigen acetylase [Frankiales bacterium]
MLSAFPGSSTRVARRPSYKLLTGALAYALLPRTQRSGGTVQYRRDIDGLRAVAVTSVVAYHLSTPQVSGGFVGVDVFFVISGFLITSLIHGELEDGRFTITDFYRRRLRRIVPALLTVLLVTCVVASCLLFDQELHELSRSAVWAGLFSSNLYFWQHAGYFDAPSTTQPLLHTWSLGVEEQFYLFFPLLLLAVHRWARRHLTVVLVVICAASFLLGWEQVRTGHVSAGFYLLPGRAWELGVGGLLAVTGLALPRAVRHAGSLLGLALIAFACHHLTSGTRFPGPAALFPVLGAALVITAGREAIGNRVLSWQPIVFVGLVSYSWYLWHWPAIVLYRLYTFNELHWSSRVAIAAGTFVLAVLSWRFVEGPLRRLRLPSRQHVFGFALVTSLAAVVLGLVVQPFSGAVHPEDKQTRALLALTATIQDKGNRAKGCFLPDGFAASGYDVAKCDTPSTTEPSVLLLGDSHAADLWYGMDEGFAGKVDVLQATASGCRPVLPLVGAGRCVTVLKGALGRLAGQHVQAIVLSGRWTAADVNQLPATIRQLKAVTPIVVVVGRAPEWTSKLPSLLARARDRHEPDLPARKLDRSMFAIDRRVERATELGGGTFVSLLDHLCPGERCRTLTDGGEPMAFDTSHFGEQASVVAAGPIVDALHRKSAFAGG